MGGNSLRKRHALPAWLFLGLYASLAWAAALPDFTDLAEKQGPAVVNISTTGVRIFSQRDFEDAEVLVEDLIHISITVTPNVVLNCKAKVRYVKDRVLGLEFRPRIEGPLLDHFARWVFQKQEEELILQSGRGDG